MTTLQWMHRRRTWFAALGAVLIAACGGGGGGSDPEPAEIPVVLGQAGPGDPDNWMPIAVASRWQFRGTRTDAAGSRSFTNLVEIRGVGSVNGVGTLRLYENNYGGDGITSVSDIVGDNNGIAVLAVDDDGPLPAALLPYWEIRYPLTPGSRFLQRDRRGFDFGSDLDGDGRNETASLRTEVQVVGTESVTVPLGRFDGALRVNRSSTLSVRLSRDGSTVSSTESASAWYVRNIGWVRRTQTVTAGTLTSSVDEGLEVYFAGGGNGGAEPVSGPIATGVVPASGVVTHVWFSQAVGRYALTLSALDGEADLVVPAAPQCPSSGARSGTLPEDCVFEHDGQAPLLAQVRGTPGTRYSLALSPAFSFPAPVDETALVVVSTPYFGQVGARGTSTYQTNGLGSGGRYSITISGLDADADLLVYSDATYSMPVCGLTGTGDVLPLAEECVVDNTSGTLYFKVRAGELVTTGVSYQITVVPAP